ncbi:MAG: hypothetical protein C0391_06475 [Anaerolinea sp.]|nr:hypothetical protein [Anaerolinea sp.]
MNLVQFTKKQQVVFFFILFMAVLIRLLNLGRAPLSDAEAALSLQVLPAHAGSSITWAGEPLYLLLTGILFRLFDQTNFIARTIPALFGLGLVFLPLLFQKQIGRLAAIVLAGFLAFDPAMISLSRTAGSGAIALFLVSLSFWLFINKRTIATGIICGLFLISGTGLWTVLTPLLVAGGLYWLFAVRITKSQGTASNLDFSIYKQRTFWLAVVFSVILTGTLFFLYPQALSATPSSLVDYLQVWSRAGGLPAKLIWLGVVIYFPAGIIFGIWGGIRGVIGHSRLAVFLSWWVLAGLMLILINPGRQVLDVAWVSIPLLTLASIELARHFKSPLEELLPSAGTAILVITMISFFYLSVARLVYSADQKQLLLAVTGGAAILIICAFLIIMGWSQSIAGRGFLWGLMALLFVYSFSTAWRVSGISAEGQVELIRPQASHPQLALINQTVQEVSRWNRGGSNQINVTVAGFDSDALEWSLKNYNPEFSISIDRSQMHELVLTEPDYPVSLGDQFRGQDFIFEQTVNWQDFSGLDWIAWIVHRKVITTNNSIILWARADLFPGGSSELPLQP